MIFTKIFRAKWLKWKLLFYAYESRRSSQGMRFATSGLSVTKHGAAEAFHRHFNEVLDTGVLQDILLRSIWLENDVVWEYLRLFVAAACNRIALRDKRRGAPLEILLSIACGEVCRERSAFQKVEGSRPRTGYKSTDAFMNDNIFVLTYICPSPGNCTAISSPDLISLLPSGRTLRETRVDVVIIILSYFKATRERVELNTWRRHLYCFLEVDAWSQLSVYHRLLIFRCYRPWKHVITSPIHLLLTYVNERNL